MPVIGVGSITITDFNDAISIVPNIIANHPLTIGYDPATGVYNPDWVASPLTLTPVATVGGRSGDIIQGSSNQKWYYRRNGEDWTQISNGVGNFTINATTYVLGLNVNSYTDSAHTSLEFKFEFTYHDNTLNLDFPCEVHANFFRVSNGTSVVIARAWSNGGNQFKNQSLPASIEIETELLRGTASDTSALSYQWQKTIGGVWTNISGATSKTYTVTAESVLNYGQFRCLIHDDDSSSDTYNQTFTSDTILISDLTDPYKVELITTSGSSIIKNGAGSATVKAKVSQNNIEIDAAGTELSYRWYKVGVGTTLWTSKTYTIPASQVSGSNDFQCEVSK
jgi:hypothetical protein